MTVYLIFLNVNYIFTASIISSILLLTAVIVYAFVKELRTVSGKCTIFFLLALLVVQVTTALTHLGVYVLRSSDILNAIGGVGFLFSFFWMHVLSFDVFWTFKWVENKPSILLKLFFAWCVFFCFFQTFSKRVWKPAIKILLLLCFCFGQFDSFDDRCRVFFSQVRPEINELRI